MTLELTQELRMFFETNGVDPTQRDTSEYFIALVKAAVSVYSITMEEIARGLSVSIPTVERWEQGRNLPYHSETASVRNIARDELEKKLKNYNNNVYSYYPS